MTESQLLLLWGKTCRDANDPEADFKYHPLLFHLLDVAHSAQGLWDEFLSERWKHRLAVAFGCDEASARVLVAFLAGAHDLGKATPGFQFQPHTPLGWLCEELSAFGLCATSLSHNEPHNFVSSKELNTLWMEDLWDWKAKNKRVAPVLAHITGAHHGTFPNSSDYERWKEDVLGDGRWREARLGLLEALAKHLCPPDWEFPATLQWSDIGAIPHLAGLISVADWIGSSPHFKIMGKRGQTPSAADYAPLSVQRGRRALDDFGFARAPKPTMPRPKFAPFWGFEPNPLQSAVIEATSGVSAPFLLLCEAPMGAGKTESALWAADAAWSAGVNEGLYLALPTQATSNAMFERVREFLPRRIQEGPINLQLAHGNAGLLDLPKVVWKSLSQIYSDLQSDPEKARVVALSWFCSAKRPLLAPFGVGTIDQSLMATLQTRHYFVRLFGLAGKVVVFDEVHAYDTYMSELLGVLLGWLRELGCSVILLSATLPSSKRRELLWAWGIQTPDQEAPYPRLTWCAQDESRAVSIPIETSEGGSKIVGVSCLVPERLAEELRQKLASGGSAAIICNTVAQAQSLFLSLRDELSEWSDAQWILFHARMPFCWRHEREEQIRSLFGKKKAKRPHRAIVVATQVLEQSLDIDFDWMASFMAPSDLLLQRVGRLHRHALDEEGNPVRRYDLKEPQLAILCDTQTQAPPDFGASEWVYEREILLRSWLLWRDKTALRLPEEIESLIEETYETPRVAPDEIWQKALSEAGDEARLAREKSSANARQVVVPLRNGNGTMRAPTQIVDSPSKDLKDDDDPTIHTALRARTREGDESVTVICLCRHKDRIFLPDQRGAPDFQSPIDLATEPDKPTAKKLMDFTVPLSNKAIYHALINTTPPPTWKKSPFLRNTRPIYFQDGLAHVGNKILRLDGDLGIVIQTPEDKEPEESAV